MSLQKILTEAAKEQAAVDFLQKVIAKSPFRGKVYLAGGYVRDEILGKDSKDIDLVIELPEGGERFAKWITRHLGVYRDGSNPVIYKTYGTAKFNLRGIKYNGEDLSDVDIECVMTRKEQYKQGSRKPKVEPGTLAQDVERRDFTVNSLLKDLTTGEVLDLTGKGKKDIENGVIRTALNPDIIFAEDPLRMLRAIRFAVKYNWSLPMSMIRSMRDNADQLKNISAERIQSELNKMLVSGSPDKAIRLLQLTGLNKYVAPELDNLKGLTQNKYHQWDANKHTLEVLKNVPPNLVARLSALFHDIGKAATKEIINNEVHFYEHENVGAEIAKDIMRRLKYPNDIIDAVTKIVANHMRLKSAGPEGDKISDKGLRKLQADLGDHLQDTLDIMHADNVSHADSHSMPNQIPNIKSRLQKIGLPKEKIVLPVNGHDLMKAFNLTPGPKLKQMLSAIKDAYLENPDLTKNQALKIAKRYV